MHGCAACAAEACCTFCSKAQVVRLSQQAAHRETASIASPGASHTRSFITMVKLLASSLYTIRTILHANLSMACANDS